MKNCEISDKTPSIEQMAALEKLMDKLPDDDKLQVKSQRFKALSDPTRLKILYLLVDGELCACEIICALKKPQSTISHHLNILRSAGFIKGRKEGVWIHYMLENHRILTLLDELTELI